MSESLTNEVKGMLINGIIGSLNETIKEKNKKLCTGNLFLDQKPLHGADMFFTLANIEDAKLRKIASACGI